MRDTPPTSTRLRAAAYWGRSDGDGAFCVQAPARGRRSVTAELNYLVWSAALTLVLVLIAVTGAALAVGVARLVGNREPALVISGWAGRAQRAHVNLLESLVLFAILVLVAHATGVRTGLTLLGAQLFFWGRLVHAVVYIAGIAWVRTAAWLVSVAGLIVLFVEVLR